MVADPLTARHLQPYRHSPYILDVDSIALRVQNLVKPTRRELTLRLISPRRPVFLLVSPMLPSV